MGKRLVCAATLAASCFFAGCIAMPGQEPFGEHTYTDSQAQFVCDRLQEELAELQFDDWGGYSIDSGMDMVDTLLNRGGITGMSSTAILFIFAFGLFGVLNAAGIIDALVEPLTRHLQSKLSVIVATLGMSVLGNAIGASSNFAYVFAGNIMAPIYDRTNFDKVNLSRALAVGCTAMCTLLPWNMNAVVAAGYIGVSPAQLIPFTFFAFVTPVVLLAVTILGGAKTARSAASK